MTIQHYADVLIHRAARSIVEPYAVFAYDQPDFEGGSWPMYTIYGGGVHNGSSVTKETLDRLGIAVRE